MRKSIAKAVVATGSADETIEDASARMRQSITAAIIAAGGADRNRGNAEKLRRYWTRGKGALKIRWGQPGDWKRCVRHLAKYLGPRAKGYCQLRHKEALGFYTSTHAKRYKKNLSELDQSYLELFGALFSDAEDFATEVSEEDMGMTLDAIFAEEDQLFDFSWIPESEIVSLLTESDISEFAADDDELEDLTKEDIEALKVEKMNRERDKGDAKYTPQTQPRDTSGKFRKVLARLKSDLGTAGLSRVVEKVEEAENLENAGDYGASAKAASELLGLLDRLDAKALNPESLENVRNTAAELGKVIANLPLAFGKDAEKIRFSDIPPALKDLMEDMVKKVEEKIGEEDADIATEKLRSFMSGGDYFNQSEVSSEMSKLLRLLT
jgi:hypothetical protein